MRMWMIDPKCLCDKHLLGEHGELHRFRHSFIKGHSVAGRLSPIVQIEPVSMERRHNELAEEMVRRGMKHQSPYTQPALNHYPAQVMQARVDLDTAVKDLYSRCEACRKNLVNGLQKA